MLADRRSAFLAATGLSGGFLPSCLVQHQKVAELSSSNLAVRQGLADLFSIAPLADLSGEARGVAEIVLAEALNNIVEHAYRDGPGEILVGVDRDGALLRVTVYDQGRPMPGGLLPEGRLASVMNPEDLPEGGFGWHLIRTLTHGLDYMRHDGCNRLRFQIPV